VGILGHLVKPGLNLLAGLLEDLNELADNVLVLLVDEGSSETIVTGTASTTNTVHIVINVRGKVEVDNVLDVSHIKTARSDISGHEDTASAILEGVQSRLTLALGAITVDGSSGDTLVVQELLEVVSHTLGLNEDKSTTLNSGEKLDESTLLVVLRHVLDALGDKVVGGTNTADREEGVLRQEILSKTLDSLGEGSGEHKGLSVVDVGALRDDSVELLLETHVKHAVSLVNAEESYSVQSDLAALNHINETTGSSDEDVTASLEGRKLSAELSTTIHAHDSEVRAVGELVRLLGNLHSELSGGGEDEGGRIGLVVAATHTTLIDRRRGVRQSQRDQREQESTSLSGTSLSTGHKVSLLEDNRHRVSLHGGGLSEASKTHIVVDHGTKVDVSEGFQGLREVVALDLNINIVVLVEVDTGVGTREKL
jgi:hypothetical protein